jgi:sigma-B regulation protein RsbU (phosphoserine phosphatase)
MNDSLSAMNENDMFVTMFCGVLDLTAGRLRYCNAGHNPPMILTDAIRPLAVQPNLPLGVVSGCEFKEQETDFCYDDALFLYTDGLTEAENAAHEQFGEARMEEALHGRKSAEAHLENIRARVAAFVGNAPQSDDLTMLFIHYLGQGAERHGDLLVLHNEVSQISRLEGWLEYLQEKYDLDPLMVPGLNLALEEAVTNVVLYAYPEGSYGSAELKVSQEGKTLRFVLSDSGKPFDPTARPEVDITARAEDRPIGGLGIHLVRQIMDQVDYRYENGKNILTMTKNI